jgi:hypothetical protein
MSLASLSLIAQHPLTSMSTAIREKPVLDSSALAMVAIALGAVLVALAIAYHYYRLRESKLTGNYPWLLFRELCSAHSLGWFQRRAMMKLAKAMKLTDASLLMLDAHIWPDQIQLQKCFSQRVYGQLSQCRRHIFQPLPIPSQQPTNNLDRP